MLPIARLAPTLRNLFQMVLKLMKPRLQRGIFGSDPFNTLQYLHARLFVYDNRSIVMRYTCTKCRVLSRFGFSLAGVLRSSVPLPMQALATAIP